MSRLINSTAACIATAIAMSVAAGSTIAHARGGGGITGFQGAGAKVGGGYVGQPSFSGRSAGYGYQGQVCTLQRDYYGRRIQVCR